MVMGNCHDCDGHGGWRVEYNRDVSSTALSHTQTHTHSLAQGARLRHGSCTGSVIVEQGEGLHLRLERGEDVHLAAARQRPALTTQWGNRNRNRNRLRDGIAGQGTLPTLPPLRRTLPSFYW